MQTSPSKLSIALFVLVTAIVTAFLVMFLSRFFIPKDAGLAGGAMVVGYGVMGFFGGMLFALILQRFLGANAVKLLNMILGFASVCLLSWLGYRIYSSGQEGRDQASAPLPPKTMAIAQDAAAEEVPLPPLSAGIGIAKPPVVVGQPLYFYAGPVASALMDSLLLAEAAYGQMDIGHAPEGLKPEYLKLDYQILLFLAKSRSGDFLEIVANKQTGKTVWVEEKTVTFQDWPTFLLSVHSVEPLDPVNNLIREEPFNHAPPLVEENISGEWILQPLRIEGAWMEVEMMDNAYESHGKGWIRWRNEGELWVRYNLLS